eukprot:5917615-Alexandrium_andersonii.AAC.1
MAPPEVPLPFPEGLAPIQTEVQPRELNLEAWVSSLSTCVSTRPKACTPCKEAICCSALEPN